MTRPAAKPMALSPLATDLAEDPAHLRIARSIAHKYGERFPRLADEFESECYLALASAARTFDPDKGKSFKAYLCYRVIGHMRDTLRFWAPAGYRRGAADAPREVSISVLNSIDPEVRRVDLPCEHSGPIGWELDYQELIRTATKGLTAFERHVIVSKYGRANETTDAAKAREIGVTASRFYQLQRSASEQIQYAESISPGRFDSGTQQGHPPGDHVSKIQQVGRSVWSFFCPGCDSEHRFNQGWEFNGDFDRPTITPPIFTTTGHYRADYKPGNPCGCSPGKQKNPGVNRFIFACRRCHALVTDGKIQYFSDCSHAMAGKTIELPDAYRIPDAYRRRIAAEESYSNNKDTDR